MTAGGVDYVIAADAEDLATRLAEALARLIASVPDRPVHVVLAGGTTPRRAYEVWSAMPDVDWARVVLWFGDERRVPPDDPSSNYGMVREALLGRVPVTAHRMCGEATDGDAAARAYEASFRREVDRDRGGVPAVDLVLLGIGTDGHTASLFPGTAALSESQRLVVTHDVPGRGSRMTITYPLIAAADRVWMVASGADKREIVTACFAAAWGDAPSVWPVVDARPADGRPVWWLDTTAGASLRKIRQRG